VGDDLAHDQRGLGALDALDREDARIGVEQVLRVAARDAHEQIHLTREPVSLDDLRTRARSTAIRGRSAWRTMTLMNASIGYPSADDEIARSYDRKTPERSRRAMRA
jgi:hypothetical protein